MSEIKDRIEGIRQREGIEGAYVNAIWALEELEAELAEARREIERLSSGNTIR